MNPLRTSLAVAALLLLAVLGTLLAVEIDSQNNFNTDFEADEGYAPGLWVSDPVWTIGGSSEPEVGSFAYTGSLGLNLDGGDHLSIDFSSLETPAVGWIDLYLKPAFNPPEDLRTSFPLGQAALTGFVTVGVDGEVYVLHGDGAGGGTWMATGYVVSLNGNSALNWMRLTYRLDYASQRWDLFLDDSLQMIDIGFVDASAPLLSHFTLEGSTEGSTQFDQFTAGFINPLFADADNDGIDDIYEGAQGMSTSTNDRDGDLDLDTISNIAEYMDGLDAGNADTDGDGVHDGAEIAAGANPLVADAYQLEGLPYAESFESYATGDLIAQSLWEITGGTAVVQEAQVLAGNQSLELLAGASVLELKNNFDGSDQSQVWLDFYMQPLRYAERSDEQVEAYLDAEATCVFYFLENDQVVLLDGDGQGGGNWVVLDHQPSQTDWTQVTVGQNYADQEFELLINAVPLAGSYGFANQQPYFTRLMVKQDGATATYLDQISVSESPPNGFDSDGDGISDEDEDLNGNGLVDAGETDPLLADTDGDGIGDGASVKLRLWLRSDTGVIADASGRVQSWEDQSIYQEDAAQTTAALQPALVDGAYNGQPAVQFDGVDDYLSGLTGFDASASDFTIIAVQRKTGGHDNSASFSYSTSATSYGAPLLRWGPQANNFGINEVGYGPDGVYVDLGSDHADQLYIATARRSGGVNGLGGDLTVSALTHNQSVQATGTQSWTSGSVSGYYLGRKMLSSNHMFGGDILEVRVYDGALSPEQALLVNQELGNRYGLSLDLDFDDLPDSWEEGTFGSLEWSAMDDPDGDGVNNLREFNLGTDANVADVTDIIQSNFSLRLHLDASTAVLDGSGAVEQLPDLSGWNDHAVQSDPAKRPALASAALGGQDALSLDGVDDYLSGSSTFDASAGDFTLIAVSKQNTSNGLSATLSYSSSDTALGAPLLRWNRPDAGDLGINDVGRSTEGSFVALADAAEKLQLVSVRRSGGNPYGQNSQLTVRALSDLQTLENTTAQSWLSGATNAYFIGRKKTTAGGNNDFFSGQVAEVLVFDRALSDSELLEIEEILAAKYQITLDVDSDGWADSDEIGLFGDLSQSPDSDYDGDGVSNQREINLGLDPVTADVHSPVLAVDSLTLWLSADQGVTTDAGGLISQWADISGYGAQIEQGSAAAQPALIADALNTHPVVRFDGTDDYLLGDAGWAPASGDYSMFIVHRRTGGHDKAATLSFNQPTGSAGAPLLRWGPAADHIGINNVGVNADGVYTDLGSDAGEYLLSSIRRTVPADPAARPQLSLSHESSSALYTADGDETWSSALSAEFALGRKAADTTHYFGGDIAEVILFDASLSGDELAAIQDYLSAKYGIDSDPDGDGLDNATELSLGTDPQSADSDGDSLPDGWELAYELDPLVADDASSNSDGDLLSLYDEYHFGTNPTLQDTDGDGLDDGYAMPGAVKREIWDVTAIRTPNKLRYALSNTSFPFAPDRIEWMDRLESPRDVANQFSDRTRGYIIPDETREYIFHLSADNETELWLSSDHHSFNRSLVAKIDLLVAWDQLIAFDPVYLEEGKKYYFEILHAEGRGRDHFRVAWSEPGGEWDIISGANLMSWHPDAEDQDDDGLQDSWELANGLDPTDDGSSNRSEGSYGDFDSDGLRNIVEKEGVTNITLADTDGDTYVDWVEQNYFGTSPVDALDVPQPTLNQSWQVKAFGEPLSPVAYDELGTDKLHLLAAGDGIDLRTSDSAGYFYQTVTGDFSVTVSYDKADQAPGQVQMDGAIAFALMARESLDADSRYVNALVRRALSDFNLGARLETGGVSFRQDKLVSYPSPYDKAWVRLERRGNSFAAYASSDNATWTLIGEQSLDLPQSLHLGFSVFSGGLLEYTSAVIEVTEWYTDFDNDGIWDADEALYGTSVTEADSDGDGYSDYEEINEFFTDPTVADLEAETITDSNTGSESVAELGDWIVDGAVTYSREGRGSVEYEMTVPEDGIYRISLLGQTRFNETGRNLYNVKVSVDGVYIGRIFLNDVESEAGTGRILSPWLKAGTHTLKFYVDNTYTYRSLQINEVSVGYVGGPDDNQDTIPDWMTNRLEVLNGFDNASASAVTQSQVSPFCLKGRSRFLAFSASTDVEQILNPFPDFEFYTDVTLDPTVDTNVTIDFENQGLTQTAQIEWIATNLADTTEITIRKGDALLLTAFEAATLPGDSVEIDLGDGSTPVTTTVDTPLEAIFDSAGEFTVTATVNSVAHQMTVTVMEAELGDSISLLIDRDFNYQPAALSENAAVSIDQAVVMAEVTQAEQPREFILTGAESEPAVLAASTPSGAVLDHVDLNTFYLASNDETHIQVLETFPDGDRLISTNIVLDYVPDDIELEVYIFVGGVTFSDGSIRKYLTAADFDELGRATLYFISPAGVDPSVCHRINVTVGDTDFGNI